MIAIGTQERNDVMDFDKWLANQLKLKGWSQTELANRATLSTGTISNILAGRRNPDHDTLIKIANGLSLPIETVYTAAGHLPNRSPDNATFNQVLDLMKSMDASERKELLDYALWRYSKKEKESKDQE